MTFSQRFQIIASQNLFSSENSQRQSFQNSRYSLYLMRNNRENYISQNDFDNRDDYQNNRDYQNNNDDFQNRF